MLAEMVMFIQVLGMAVRASILPWIGVMCMIYLIYTHRSQLLDILQGILRIICWVIICLIDGKAKADGIKVKKI